MNLRSDLRSRFVVVGAGFIKKGKNDSPVTEDAIELVGGTRGGGRPGGKFAGRSFGGRLPLDKVGQNTDGLVRPIGLIGVDHLQQRGGGDAAHFLQGLAHGGERRIVGGGAVDVVKADDGDLRWDGDAGFAQNGDGSDGGEVVEGEDGGEGQIAFEKADGGGATGFGTEADPFQLDDEPRVDFDSDFRSDFGDGAPAGLGIGAEALAFDEGDFFVSQALKVFERIARGEVVIELDVHDGRVADVARNCDDGNGERVVEDGVNGDDAFDSAGDEHGGILTEQIGAVAVTYDEVEEAGEEKDFFNAAKDGGGVAFADFRNNDADGFAVLAAQAAGEAIGLIVHAGGGGADALLGLGGYAIDSCGVVEDPGNGGGGQAEVAGQLLQAGLFKRARRGIGWMADSGHFSCRFSAGKSGCIPIFCWMWVNSGLDMKECQTRPVRPFSIIAAMGAWFSPMVIPEYQFCCWLKASRNP